MTNIVSEKKTVSYPAEKVYSFISNFNNFKELLPEDKLEDWQSTETTCSFKIKGMASLGLRIDPESNSNKVTMHSDGKVPFPFKFDVNIEGADNNSDVHIAFEGDINPFMKMMVEKPLTNFFNMLVDKLTTLDLS